MIRTAIFTLILTATVGLSAISANAQGCISMLGVQSGNCTNTGSSTTGTYRAPDATANLYQKSNGVKYARVDAFTGSHYEVYPVAGTSVLKTYKDSCRPVETGGVAGQVCSFAQFHNGQVIYSGWALIYTNGSVYIRWMYAFTAGVQRTSDSGWIEFYVAP